jgi:hypothetical protein
MAVTQQVGQFFRQTLPTVAKEAPSAIGHKVQFVFRCIQDNVSSPKLLKHDFTFMSGVTIITEALSKDFNFGINKEVASTISSVGKGINAVVSLLDVVEAIQYFVGAGRDGKPEVVKSWNDSRYATIGSRLFNLGAGTFAVIDFLESQGVMEPIKIFGESAKSIKDGLKVTGFVFDLIDACDLIRRVATGKGRNIDWFGDIVLLIAGATATTCLIVFGSSQGAYGLGALLIVSSGIGIYKGIYKSEKEFCNDRKQIDKERKDEEHYREAAANDRNRRAAAGGNPPAGGNPLGGNPLEGDDSKSQDEE